MRVVPVFCLILGASLAFPLLASPRKVHSVALGATKRVAYSKAGDPAGAAPGEDSLKVRPLVVDGSVKEWTTGDSHEVTDRSFVVRRALRINDELPGEKPAGPAAHWVWQRGSWLLVERATGHISAIRLPDYDPAVSQVTWFRDYAAYCGLTASGKSLQAIVAQLAARKPAISKKLSAFPPDASGPAGPACAPPEWQREPLRVTFHPMGREPVSVDVVPGSALLVEDTGDDAEAPPAKRN